MTPMVQPVDIVALILFAGLVAIVVRCVATEQSGTDKEG
jgi:hypothetical protein